MLQNLWIRILTGRETLGSISKSDFLKRYLKDLKNLLENGNDVRPRGEWPLCVYNLYMAGEAFFKEEEVVKHTHIHINKEIAEEVQELIDA